MSTRKENRILPRLFVGAGGLMAVALFGVTASAQTLSISSLVGSSNGTTPRFGPGDTVTAVVTLQNGPYPLSQAWLVAGVPIGFNTASTVIDASDLQGTFSIAPNVPFGSYRLTAFAQDTHGNVYQSAAVPFTVAVFANSYQILPNNITLRYVGDLSWIRVYGVLEGGNTVDMTYATTSYIEAGPTFLPAPVNYTSLNTNIASVDNFGRITAVGPGVTCIGIVAYSYVPASSPYYYPGEVTSTTMYIQVTVPSSIRGDLNGDGLVNDVDLKILEERLNSPAITSVLSGNDTIPVKDARDLNDDGVIDALDARILVTLCTEPGCVVR
jgi:hypothetical protein